MVPPFVLHSILANWLIYYGVWRAVSRNYRRPANWGSGRFSLASDCSRRQETSTSTTTSTRRKLNSVKYRRPRTRPREWFLKKMRSQCRLLMRSMRLVISVMRMPYFLFCRTTSPLAINFSFARMSTGSPSSFESVTAEPGPRSSNS
jgi:hypothetical protein